MTDEVAVEFEILSLIDGYTDSSPADKGSVRDLNVVRSVDEEAPVIALVDRTVRDLGLFAFSSMRSAFKADCTSAEILLRAVFDLNAVESHGTIACFLSLNEI